MSKDPNFTETDLFSFEAGPAKLKKSRSKKAERNPSPRPHQSPRKKQQRLKEKQKPPPSGLTNTGNSTSPTRQPRSRTP